MIRWVVIFKDTPEMLGIRADQSRRDAHVSYIRKHPELLIGGGLKPDLDSDLCGALSIVEAKSLMDVEQLIKDDPFYFKQFREFNIFTWGKILEDQSVSL